MDIISHMESLFFWWSILSTVISVMLLMWGIVQAVSKKKEQEIHKAQVKIWQHHAGGINHGLFMLEQKGGYSSVNDVQQAIKVLQPTANSLFTSLNEERLFSEEEIKEKQLKQERSNEEFIAKLRGVQSSPGSNQTDGK